MWLSLYIYHGDDLYGRDLDRLLVLAVAPLVERLRADGRLERFFFVRYQSPQSHLRLRLEVRKDDTAAIDEEVRTAVTAFLRGEGESGVPTRPARIERVGYVPEQERYGGHSGVRVAEKHFALSSGIALEVLAETLDAGASHRLGKSLLLTLILARSFCGDFGTAASFLRWYAESYLFHMLGSRHEREAFRRRLTTKTAAVRGAVDHAVSSLLVAARRSEGWGRPRLDRWSQGCFEIRQEIRRLPGFGSPARTTADPGGLTASLLHMHHNRLGLSIPQEVHLAHLAAGSLVRQETTS